MNPHHGELTSERPPSRADRYDKWYGKAVHVDGFLVTGPRFSNAFEAIFAREYEAEAMADSAPDLEDSL
jgi:predicted RNase H-like nuclease